MIREGQFLMGPVDTPAADYVTGCFLADDGAVLAIDRFVRNSSQFVSIFCG